MIIEYGRMGNRRAQILAFLTLLLEAIVLLTFRVHYFIDIVVAISMAHYLSILL